MDDTAYCPNCSSPLRVEWLQYDYETEEDFVEVMLYLTVSCNDCGVYFTADCEPRSDDGDSLPE